MNGFPGLPTADTRPADNELRVLQDRFANFLAHWYTEDFIKRLRLDG